MEAQHIDTVCQNIFKVKTYTVAITVSNLYVSVFPTEITVLGPKLQFFIFIFLKSVLLKV